MTIVKDMLPTKNDRELFDSACDYWEYSEIGKFELLHSEYDEVEVELLDIGLHRCDDCKTLMGDGHVHEALGEFCEPCAGKRWTAEQMQELYDEHEATDYNDGMYWTQWVFS